MQKVEGSNPSAAFYLQIEALHHGYEFSDESSRELWCNGLAGTSLQPSRAATSFPLASAWSSRTKPIDSFER
jgi:hypothetical protein